MIATFLLSTPLQRTTMKFRYMLVILHVYPARDTSGCNFFVVALVFVLFVSWFAEMYSDTAVESRV